METTHTKYCSDYREALKFAIQREVDAVHFYEKAAEKVHEAEPKSLLKRLAIEEKRHQALLNSFSQEMKTAPKGSFIPPDNFTYAVSENDLQNPRRIFELAIRKEEESLNFYSRLLVYFFGTGQEEVFVEIFKMEQEHKERLERNMEDFLKK